MSQAINIIIADDHPLFVEGLKMILASDVIFKITGIAQDGKQLLYLLTQQPETDLILLDVNMPVQRPESRGSVAEAGSLPGQGLGWGLLGGCQ